MKASEIRDALDKLIERYGDHEVLFECDSMPNETSGISVILLPGMDRPSFVINLRQDD